jgi:hypothetical protein
MEIHSFGASFAAFRRFTQASENSFSGSNKSTKNVAIDHLYIPGPALLPSE